MCGEVRYAPNGVALHFNIRAEHLTNEWLQSPESDDKQFVLGFARKQSILALLRYVYENHSLFTARLPRAALAAR